MAGGSDLCFSDHLYGEHPSQFVRLWLPVSNSPAPIVYVLHGGFWKAKYGLNTGAGTACESIAPDLARRGFAAVEVEYRRGDDFPYPTPNEDVVAAVQFVGKKLKKAYNLLQANSAALLGFSAGGQLVLWAALELEASLCPQTVIAVAPVADLELAAASRLSDDGDAVTRYMGGTFVEKASKYRRACPTCRAEELAQLPSRVVIVAGGADEDVPLRIVNSLRRGLTSDRDGKHRTNVNPSFLTIPTANHYDMMNAQDPAWEQIAALLP